MDLELRLQLRINTKYKGFMHGGREQSQQYISYFLELNTMIKWIDFNLGHYFSNTSVI